MNTNIQEFKPLIKPNQLNDILPIDTATQNFVIKSRTEIQDIIHKKSNKKLFIVGPRFIHDVDAALQYAKKLKIIADKVKDKIFIVMRVYFEKPRTTIGWKGLINDPLLDDSFNVNKGLYLARELLLNINQLGLPCGYEVLDTITPQYITDLISWAAIGARTVESQVHRQMVSGLSMPVGFKNSTSGDISLAVNAILSASYLIVLRELLIMANLLFVKLKVIKIVTLFYVEEADTLITLINIFNMLINYLVISILILPLWLIVLMVILIKILLNNHLYYKMSFKL